MCAPTGKVRYDDKVAANTALDRAAGRRKRTRGRHRRQERRAYWCPSCHGWHLTSMDWGQDW